MPNAEAKFAGAFYTSVFVSRGAVDGDRCSTVLCHCARAALAGNENPALGCVGTIWQSPVLDLLAYQRSTASASKVNNVPISPTRPRPNDVAASADNILPTGDVIADAYADAADPTGEVKSTKQVPAPDSLGG
jgi:hypothetical protein